MAKERRDYMVIVAYDISNDRTRTRFSKFLSKYGHRIQYSMFEIKNSQRILDIITLEINKGFEKYFKETDSVVVLKLSKQCKVEKYGYAKHDDEEVIVI